MKPILRQYGRVKGGNRFYYKPELNKKILDGLEGKEFEEVIQIRQESITTDQYGFYFGAIIATCMETEVFGGWTKDEIDAHFCELFLSTKTLKTIGGNIVEIKEIGSKSSLNKDLMSRFIDQVINYLVQFEIYIEDPSNYVIKKYNHASIKGYNKIK